MSGETPFLSCDPKLAYVVDRPFRQTGFQVTGKRFPLPGSPAALGVNCASCDFPLAMVPFLGRCPSCRTGYDITEVMQAVQEGTLPQDPNLLEWNVESTRRDVGVLFVDLQLPKYTRASVWTRFPELEQEAYRILLSAGARLERRFLKWKLGFDSLFTISAAGVEELMRELAERYPEWAPHYRFNRPEFPDVQFGDEGTLFIGPTIDVATKGDICYAAVCTTRDHNPLIAGIEGLIVASGACRLAPFT